MQVVDGLAGLASDVRDEPIAGLGDALPASDVGGHREQATEDGPSASVSSGAEAMCCRGMHQDVGRGVRRDVAEGEDEVVLVQERRPGPRRRRSGRTGSRSTRGRSPSSQSVGFVLIRNPMIPTSPAIRYET